MKTTARSPQNTTEPLLAALKKVLRAKGLSYKDLAEQLGLSEASIKRWFSRGGMSLEQFASVLAACEVSYQDLAGLLEAQPRVDEHTYTLEQETHFAAHPKSHAFFNLLLRYGTVAKLRKHARLSDASANRHLAALERLGLIERHAHDKIRFLTSKKIVWRKNGPLRKQFLAEAKKEFLDSDFTSSPAAFRFLHIGLTERSAAELAGKISDLAAETTHQSELEKSLNPDLADYGVLLALRPWKFSKLTAVED